MDSSPSCYQNRILLPEFNEPYYFSNLVNFRLPNSVLYYFRNTQSSDWANKFQLNCSNKILFKHIPSLARKTSNE